MNYRLPQLLADRIRDRHEVLPVAEIFTTVQGEGPYVGRCATFIRFGRCNLSCSWCDTPYTWDGTRFDVAAQCPDTPWKEILLRALRPGVGLIVLTGGEPLMHQRRPAMVDLVRALKLNGYRVHVETNGTIPPTPEIAEQVTHFTVSPKLANNGADPARRRIRPAALAAFRHLAIGGRACFKFVATSAEDLDEIAAVVDQHRLPAHAVWVMPEGTDAAALLDRHRALIGGVIERGWNTTTRLHTLLWGEERGR